MNILMFLTNLKNFHLLKFHFPHIVDKCKKWKNENTQNLASDKTFLLVKLDDIVEPASDVVGGNVCSD